jgi:membrane protease YdiL (CAAX protease family)
MNIFINDNEQRLRAGWRLLIQLIIMFLLVGFGMMGLQFLVSNSLIIASVFPQFIGIIASIWIAARLLDRRSFFDYGLNFNRRWQKDFLTGTAIAAFAVGTIFLIEWWAGWITIIEYGWNVDAETPFGLGLSSFFLAMLMVGFYEELFSRGYQILNLTEGLRYPNIGEHGAIIIAILLTSALFGFMHFFNANASAISTFNIILAGIVLATPYILTGSLALSVGLHFSWNFVMAGVLGFPVSGKEIETTILHIQQGGTDLWTGGSFGPEAGILGLLGMAIMLGGSCVYIKWAGYELSTAELFQKEYRPALKSDGQTP